MTTPRTSKRHSDAFDALFGLPASGQAESGCDVVPSQVRRAGVNPAFQMMQAVQNKRRAASFEQPFLVERPRVYEEGGCDF